MRNEQILEQAIEKAVKNGWKKIPLIWNEDRFDDWEGVADLEPEHIAYIIFSHDFAKAFWKLTDDVAMCDCNKEYWYSYKHCPKCGKELKRKTINTGLWKNHLKEMVLEEYPIQYLKQFLK